MPIEILDYKTGDVGLGSEYQNLDMAVAEDSQSIKFSDIYSYGGQKLGYISRYPEYSPLRDNEEFYANQQGFWNKMGNGVSQLKARSINSFANHFKGYERQFKSIGKLDWNSFWKDDFGEETARLNLTLQDKYPIYETKEQLAKKQQGGAWAAVTQYVPFTNGASNAWANMLGQLGFTIGTIGAVAAENMVIGALTGGVGVATNAARSGKAMKSLYQGLQEGKTLTSLRTARYMIPPSIAKVGKGVFMGERMFIAAAGEASIEANISSMEFVKDQIEKYKENYGEEPPPEILQEIHEDAKKVGNRVYNWNLPVLMASNYMLIGNMFKKGVIADNYFGGVTKEVLEQGGRITTLKSTMSEQITKLPKALQMPAKVVTKVGGGILSGSSEGLEEVAQGAGAKVAQHQFDRFSSEYNEGATAFAVSAINETINRFGTREGWDEFVAGVLTKGIIGGGQALLNRGAKAKKQAIIQEGVDILKSSAIEGLDLIKKSNQVIDPTNPNNSNYINQTISGLGQQEAVENGDEKTAQDFMNESETDFFHSRLQYGILDESIDIVEESLRELQESDPNALKDALKGSTIEESVASLRERGKIYEKDLTTLKQNNRNPYNIKTENKDYNLYETALKYAAGFMSTARNVEKRAKNVALGLQQSNFNNNITEAIIDPSTIGNRISTIESLIKAKEENKVNLEKSGQELEAQEIEELQKEKKALETLKNIHIEGNQMDKTSSSKILEALGMDINTLPKDTVRAVQDLIELEYEGLAYRSLYNLLSDKQYFDKYADSFFKTAKNNKKANRDLTSNDVIEENTEVVQLNENDFREALSTIEEVEGVVTQAEEIAKRIKEKLEEVKFVGDKYILDGKEYNTKEQIIDDLLNQEESDILNQQDSNGRKVKTLIKGNVIAESELGNSRDSIEPEAQNKPPKTFAESSSNSGVFFTNNSGVTLAHYIDYVLAQVWSGNYVLDNIVEAVANKLLPLIAEKGGINNSTITTIHFADDTIVETVNNEDINVIFDETGGRYYILTKGNAQDASRIILEQLGLNVKPSQRNWSIVTKTLEDGSEVELKSNLQSDKFTEESVNKVHEINNGDHVEMVVAKDNGTGYNSQLREKLTKGEITEKEYRDNLLIYLVKDRVVVGILRATDFLFQSQAKKESVEAFRDNIGKAEQGQSLGYVPVIAKSTARNLNFQNGNVVPTPIKEYENTTEWETEYFFATSENTLVDSKGKLVKTSKIDRGNFREGAVYMRVSKDSQHHTVQLFNQGDTTFTREEFDNGSWKDKATTNLRPNPIISKRLVIDTKQNTQFGNNNTVKRVTDEFNSVEPDLVGQEVDAELSKEDKENIAKIEEKIKKEEDKKDLKERQKKAEIAILDEKTLGKSKYEKQVTTIENKYDRAIAKIDAVIEKYEEEIDTINDKLDDTVIQDREVRTVDVTLTNDLVIEVAEATIENDTLLGTLDSGEEINIPLIEIKNISAIGTTIEETQEQEEEVVEDTKPTFEDVKNESEQIINDWLFEFGQQGSTYTLEDGTSITILSSTSEIVDIAISKDTFSTKERLVKQKKDLFSEEYSVVKERMVSMGSTKNPTNQELLRIGMKANANQYLTPTEFAIALEHAAKIAELTIGFTNTRKRQFPYQGIMDLINRLGVDADTLFANLVKTYDDSLLNGEERIQSIEGLLEKSELTEIEKEVFREVINSTLEPLVWQFITTADNVLDNNRIDGIKNILSANAEEIRILNYEVQNINNLDNSNTYVQRLKKFLSKFSMSIPNINRLNLVSLPEFKDVFIDIANTFKSGVNIFSDSIRDLSSKLRTKGLLFSYGGLLRVHKVHRKSLGRNARNVDTLNDIYTDILMFNQETPLVKNESDGLYVEIKLSKTKARGELREIQSKIEKTLGLKVPLSLLDAYYRLNRETTQDNPYDVLDPLLKRVEIEQVRQSDGTNIQIYDEQFYKDKAVKYKEENVNRYNNKIITVKDNNPYIKIGDKLYKSALALPNTNVFVVEGTGLTNKEVNDLMIKSGIRVTPILKSDVSIKTIENKIKGLEKTLNQITCN